MKASFAGDLMPININGDNYWTVNEVAKLVNITRQTLWRWRNKGLVPSGSKYRNRLIIFNEFEISRIQEYANRIEPIYKASKKNTFLFEESVKRKIE